VGSPENIRSPFGIVKISQLASEVSQVPVSIDVVQDAQGCSCLPKEVRRFSVLGTFELRSNVIKVTKNTVAVLSERLVRL